MEVPKCSLVFKVRRRKPELIRPAKPTPHEFKQLSDIDDQEALRIQIPLILFYNFDSSMHGKDPVIIIRDAIAKTLVFYYPFAGRLREGPGKKLFVECNSEGPIFIEADADVTLKQFGYALYPPFSCLGEVLYDVPGTNGILDCPLLLIQITRLKCGGFIFAVRANHCMCDAFGFKQFMKAVAELALGASAPSITPLWQRSLLSASDPPCITCIHHEYDQVDDINTISIPPDNLSMRLFFFGSTELTYLRKLLCDQLKKSTNFEILSAVLWRCRTIALELDLNDEVRLMVAVDARTKCNTLPIGYYGNAAVTPAALTTAGELCRKPLCYALELVRKAKASVTEDYIQSVANLMVIRGRPHPTMVRSYIVSDVRGVKYSDVDFGWGKPTYAGLAKVAPGSVPGTTGFFISCKSNKGEEGVLMPICLPEAAMEIFKKELNALLASKIGVQSSL